ncbi:MAG TPA: GNAT family N-acetyltransferase [Microbacteriaceae bacterium]|nr:GNAT family N-acetyltransferase [Microbacteriaceae bacterium]
MSGATDIEIGRIRPEEFATDDAVVTAAYAHDYGPRDHGDDPFYRAEWRSQAYDVLVARDAATGELLGSVTIPRPGGEEVVADARPDELGFRLLATSPAARRRGIGEALVRHVVAVAAERGLAGVVMKSQPEMVGAHALYRKLGFERDPERDGLWEGGEKVLDLHAFRIRIEDLTPEASS